MMAPTTLILDTEAVSDSIVTTIKRGFGDRLVATIRDSFDRGFDRLAKATVSSSIQDKGPPVDLNGMRKQIIGQ